MALPVLPNPSNFLAVALVINRSRDGPSFVFHYPPNAAPVPASALSSASDSHKSLEHGVGEADDAFEHGDILLERLSQPTNPLNAPESLPQWNGDDHVVTGTGTQLVPWEHVAGFPTTDLASILTPSAQYHKRLFQLSLDPLYCVSYPIHVPQTGTWKKRRKPRKASATQEAAGQDDNGASPRPNAPEPWSVPNGAQVDRQDDTRPSPDDGDDSKPSSMTMFNLVFILNPKRNDVKELVATLYYNIIKKVNKAYKYSQQQSDFVWKESKRILALKDKGREERKSNRPCQQLVD